MRDYPLYENAGQRQVADIIEADYVEEYIARGGSKPSSVRSIEDVEFEGKLIDIKTRDLNRDFSMPNLISIDRLRKNKDKEIVYLFIEYVVDGNRAFVKKEQERPITSIDWSALKIQNLGLGQLQLVDHDIPKWEDTREEWFERLEEERVKFYRKQIAKFERLINEHPKV